VFTAGCAGPEQKLGRGMSNAFEIVRMGEMRRSIEQTAIFDSPDEGYTYGVIHGFDRSWSAPAWAFLKSSPPASAVSPHRTKYFRPNPVYPESYKPGLVSDSLFDTDTYTGFSGGDVAPWVPGSRFSVFDN
jgi:hypothetical protein